MAWIREVFLTVLNMSVTAGITILVILAVRAVFRRAPRKYLYVLWLAAALRLVCPWAPESELSLFNLRALQPVETARRYGTHRKMLSRPAEAPRETGRTGGAAPRMARALQLREARSRCRIQTAAEDPTERA